MPLFVTQTIINWFITTVSQSFNSYFFHRYIGLDKTHFLSVKRWHRISQTTETVLYVVATLPLECVVMRAFVSLYITHLYLITINSNTNSQLFKYQKKIFFTNFKINSIFINFFFAKSYFQVIKFLLKVYINLRVNQKLNT